MLSEPKFSHINNNSDFYISNRPGDWSDQVINVVYCFKRIYLFSNILKVFIGFTQALSWILLKVLEGIFIFGTTDTNKAYQFF